MTFEDLDCHVLEWARERGILAKSDPKTQCLKMVSEVGELADAAAALDWLQAHNPDSPRCWVAGFSFGAWIGMQLLMRRPEGEGFISIAPPANLHDFTFLAPCPSSGLIVHGDQDRLLPVEWARENRDKYRREGHEVKYIELPGQGHLWANQKQIQETIWDFFEKHPREP